MDIIEGAVITRPLAHDPVRTRERLWAFLDTEGGTMLEISHVTRITTFELADWLSGLPARPTQEIANAVGDALDQIDRIEALMSESARA